MKIRPVILCGGSGTRLWPSSKKYQAKQFINFGNWTLFGKALKRIKSPIFDYPIISTNLKYIKEVKKHLKQNKIREYKIILEPLKKNTASAMLSSALIKDIPNKQALIFLSSDHLIENAGKLNNEIKNKKKYLNEKNIFIFGIKPNFPSDQYGYFLTKKGNYNLNKVHKFLEKPNKIKAKSIVKKGAYWNSGMFFIRKDSIINNFKKYQKKIYHQCYQSVYNSKYKNRTYYLERKSFEKNLSISFDYAVLEKARDINAIKLNIPWTDLGSWKEICLMFNKKKIKYFHKKNTFYRPWGSYTNLFKGKNFLIKELIVKPKGILSLQKHFYRSEHWVVTKGKPRITLNKKIFSKKNYDTIFIPKGAIHRIENPNTSLVKIIEAQLGSTLKESDIVRYADIYGRVN